MFKCVILLCFDYLTVYIAIVKKYITYKTYTCIEYMEHKRNMEFIGISVS